MSFAKLALAGTFAGLVAAEIDNETTPFAELVEADAGEIEFIQDLERPMNGGHSLLSMGSAELEKLELAETEAEAAVEAESHRCTCTTSIDRIMAGFNDMNEVDGSGKYNDKTFEGSSMVSWREFPGRMSRMCSYVQYKRLGDMYPDHTLFGRNGACVKDTRQGQIGNCWLVAAQAALSERSCALEKTFITKVKNKTGLYQMNMYPIGVKQTVTIDDKVPANSRGPVFGGVGEDGSLWPSLMEKAAAKIMGNYEMLEGGWIGEGLRLLTGAPVDMINTRQGTSWSQLFNLCEAADRKGFFMGASTSGGGNHH